MRSDRSLRVYDFHEVRLGCIAEEALFNALDARLGLFARTDSAPWDVCFDYRCGQDLASGVPDHARLIYESEMGRVFYSDRVDRLFIHSGWPISGICDPRSGETSIRFDGVVDEHLWALSHPLLTIPLIETLKRRGRFSVHAAGLAMEGKGLVIAGSSGSGKSTLALALARAGYGFLGDDMLFVSRAGDQLQLHAFPEAFDLTDDSVRLFPELADVLVTERKPGWPKRQLRVENRFGSEVVWRCRPEVIVFPRVAASAQSTLTPIGKGEALLEILPNILLTEASSSQQHLDVLTQLVSSCACYRLETGTDFVRLATDLAKLLCGVP